MKPTLITPEDIPAFTPPSEVLEAASLTSKADILVVEGSGQGQIKVEEDVQIPPLAPSTENEPASGTKIDTEEVVKESEDVGLSPLEHHPGRKGVDFTGAEPSEAHDGESEEDLEEPIAPVTEGIDVNVETEEAARRQRVAEKLAQMRGIDPFALPPQRKPSMPAEEALSPDSPQPVSISREVVTSPTLPLQHNEVEPVVVESEDLASPKRHSQDGNY